MKTHEDDINIYSILLMGETKPAKESSLWGPLDEMAEPSHRWAQVGNWKVGLDSYVLFPYESRWFQDSLFPSNPTSSCGLEPQYQAVLMNTLWLTDIIMEKTLVWNEHVCNKH